MRLGLRAQLLIVSSLLLALPFLGLRSAREIEAFLVETQEQGLASTARAVATALNERPAVFLTDSQSGHSGDGEDEAPILRIETLASPIAVDGFPEDWTDQPVGARDLISTPTTSGGDPAPVDGGPDPVPSLVPVAPLTVTYRLGQFGRNVFILIEVRDDMVVRRSSDFPAIDASDHIEIATVTADNEFLRFMIDEAGDGSSRVSRIGPDSLASPDSRLEAALVETEDGYRVEVRAPRTLIGTRLGVAVIDVDDRESRGVVQRVMTSGIERRDDLGRVFVPSPELSTLAQGLGRARSRLWVLDDGGRVLARAGTLQKGPATQKAPTWRQSLVMALRPIYGSILTQPTENFTDRPDAVRLQGPEIARALSGESAQWRRRTTDGRAAVLSAAEPVWSEGRVVGAVLAEETTNDTLAARNRAFERLFFSIALVALFGALILLAFATRLSVRIRGLRNAMERAIDRQGRVRGTIPQTTAGDEIGDLSRSFGTLLERQRQYTSYLEGLRSRLSHEIRTPVAVVRSSLDNLRLQRMPEASTVYLDRADEGLTRLITIVQRMTEASRLEQTLATSEVESFDLARVVAGCVEGYRLANPARRIEFTAETGGRALIMEGAPDLVAQLFDKLMENALDFAREGTPVEVRLIRGLGIGFLSVTNQGRPLPEEVAEKLFDSMVSSRPADAGGKVHLGLGLTIVRAIADFHSATTSASNQRDGTGVTFTVGFPLQAAGAT